jgi:hypothetical protein
MQLIINSLYQSLKLLHFNKINIQIHGGYSNIICEKIYLTFKEFARANPTINIYL